MHWLRFLEQGGSWTLVWLPHFFTDAVKRLLGEYVVLEHIFSHSDVRRQAVAHLSVDDQARAITDLDNQRNQKKNRLIEVMEQAYGLKMPKDGDVDPGNRVDQHLVILQPGVQPVTPNLAANLASAREAYVQALLERRYPNHPAFVEALTAARVARVLEHFGQILASPDGRVPAERALSHELVGTLGALGLVRGTEGTVHLVEDRTLQILEKRRQAKGLESPTVDEIRGFVDPSGLMGLQWEAQDLVVRCYALWAKRTFEYGGKPYEPMPGKPLPGQATLEKPDMPEQTEWNAALSKAGNYFGFTLAGKFLSPDNLMRLHAQLEKVLAHVANDAAALVPLLQKRSLAFGLSDQTDRLKTARSAEALCVLLRGKRPADQVRALASFQPQTSATALGKHLFKPEASGKHAMLTLLEDELLFGVFAQLRGRERKLEGAAELIEKAQEALRQDEIHVALEQRLRELAVTGQILLRPVSSMPPPSKGTVLLGNANRKARNAVEIQKAVTELEQIVERELGRSGKGLELALDWRLVRKS